MMKARQEYVLRQSDLGKLRRYNRSTTCHKCSVEVKVGDVIRRSGNNTYHFECYQRCFN